MQNRWQGKKPYYLIGIVYLVTMLMISGCTRGEKNNKGQAPVAEIPAVVVGAESMVATTAGEEVDLLTNWLYFQSEWGGILQRMRLDGSELVPLTTDKVQRWLVDPSDIVYATAVAWDKLEEGEQQGTPKVQVLNELYQMDVDGETKALLCGVTLGEASYTNMGLGDNVAIWYEPLVQDEENVYFLLYAGVPMTDHTKSTLWQIDKQTKEAKQIFIPEVGWVMDHLLVADTLYVAENYYEEYLGVSCINLKTGGWEKIEGAEVILGEYKDYLYVAERTTNSWQTPWRIGRIKQGESVVEQVTTLDEWIGIGDIVLMGDRIYYAAVKAPGEQQKYYRGFHLDTRETEMALPLDVVFPVNEVAYERIVAQNEKVQYLIRYEDNLEATGNLYEVDRATGRERQIQAGIYPSEILVGEVTAPPSGKTALPLRGEEWVYYSTRNGIHAATTDGKNHQKIYYLEDTSKWDYIISDEAHEAGIYFNYEGVLYKGELDGSAVTPIVDAYVADWQLKQDTVTGVYYIAYSNKEGNDGFVVTLDGKEQYQLPKESVQNCYVQDHQVVYDRGMQGDADEHYIYRSTQAGNQEPLLSTKQCEKLAGQSIAYASILEVDALDIYFQVVTTENEVTIGKMDTKTNKIAHIISVEPGFQESVGLKVDGDLLYVSYQEMRHSIEQLQLDKESYEIVNQGEIIAKEDNWLYLLQDNSIYKREIDTGKMEVLTPITQMYWYEDYKYNDAIKIGEWIYFHDYPPTLQLAAVDRSNTPASYYRVHVRTKEREELDPSYWQDISIYSVNEACKDQNGYYYVPAFYENDQHGLVKIRDGTEGFLYSGRDWIDKVLVLKPQGKNTK